MAEPIDSPFGLWTWVGRMMHKLNRIWQVAPMCTLVPSGEYDWTIHLLRQCGFMSNYFYHLLLIFTGWYLSCCPTFSVKTLTHHWDSWQKRSCSLYGSSVPLLHI